MLISIQTTQKILKNNPWLIQQYPCLENISLLQIYLNFLYHLNKCPTCNSYLTLTITKKNNHYNVLEKCTNHTCKYTNDISQKFNNYLGITDDTEENDNNPSSEFEKELSRNANGLIDKKYKKIHNVPYHYWSLEAPKTTGTLKNSVKKTYFNERLIQVLPPCINCNNDGYVIEHTYDYLTRTYKVTAECPQCNTLYDISLYYLYCLLEDKDNEPIVTGLFECYSTKYNIDSWDDLNLNKIKPIILFEKPKKLIADFDEDNNFYWREI